MVARISKLALLFILISVFTLPNLKSFAQVNLEEVCQSIERIEQACQTLSDIECRQLLEKCAKYYEEKSAQIEKDITKTEAEKKTLQNQISVLKKKIDKLGLQIQQSSVIIKDLGFQIKDTETSIGKTSLRIEDSRIQLANILQRIYEEDQRSLIEILLSEKELSDFFDNLMALETLNLKSQEFLGEIKNLKETLEKQKQSLDTEKGNLENVLKIQTLQKQESQTAKTQQEYFLKLTEAQYQQYLKEKEATEKRAAEIRARIFELIGVPEAPTFGEAYEIAKWVERLTGVRPAFLLAVLQQESAIGKNVGQCYLTDTTTGTGININTGATVKNVMKPMGLSGRKGDVDDFLTITAELGRDPYNTPVSCPMSYGYGGAMGPAQFIPTTWMLYRDKVKGITGKTADPWNIKDAFLAAGLYLSRYGATSKTRDSEWRAAMIYFSGSTNPQYSFYASSVLRIADGFENDIKILEASR